MYSRETLNKRDLVFRHYTSIFKSSHVLSKLGEECCELSQVIYKILDRKTRGLPIDTELHGHFWEEMAHVILFWGMAHDSLNGIGKLDYPMNERTNRLITKILSTMATKEYPARVILKDQESPLPSPEMPYAITEDGIKVCYLTPDQYREQMLQVYRKWVTVNGEEAFFDDEYFES